MSSQLHSFSHGYAYGHTPEQIEFAIKTKELGKIEVLNMFSDEIVCYNFNIFINQIDNYYNKNICSDILTVNDVYFNK